VRSWLEDPQRLQPGTRMPSFFMPLDEDNPSVRAAFPGYFGDAADRQIAALVSFVMRSPAAPAPASR